MILNEGGNIFKDPNGQIATRRINKADVAPTLSWLEQVTGLELSAHTLGTTGIAPTVSYTHLTLPTTPYV